MPSHELSKPLTEEISQVLSKSVGGLYKQHSCPENLSELDSISKSNGENNCSTNRLGSLLERARSIPASSEVLFSNESDPESQEVSETKSLPEVKRPEAIVIPEDFLCPISLELMRDPVIVATGQVNSSHEIRCCINKRNIPAIFSGLLTFLLPLFCRRMRDLTYRDG